MVDERAELFKKIFNSSTLIDHPPVLLDIGASGSIHTDWLPIAQYSHCIAFDADERELSYLEDLKKSFRSLVLYRSIVSTSEEPEVLFYLTKSPYCSSTLKPRNKDLKEWLFHDLFAVENIIKLPNISLNKVFSEQKLTYVDWFKTDSQGTDLRLFKNLDPSIRAKILVAEFEPGIIDAYEGEDKLCDLLSFMDKEDFWLVSMEVMGTYRISHSIINTYELESNFSNAGGGTSLRRVGPPLFILINFCLGIPIHGLIETS